MESAARSNCGLLCRAGRGCLSYHRKRAKEKRPQHKEAMALARRPDSLPRWPHSVAWLTRLSCGLSKSGRQHHATLLQAANNRTSIRLLPLPMALTPWRRALLALSREAAKRLPLNASPRRRLNTSHLSIRFQEARLRQHLAVKSAVFEQETCWQGKIPHDLTAQHRNHKGTPPVAEPSRVALGCT